MLTLLGSLMGFAGSAVPSVIDLFKEKSEQKKQLDLAKLQIEAKEKGVDLDIRMMNAQADLEDRKSSREEQQRLLEHDMKLGQQGGFINSLRAFVRPFITYVFFSAFIGVKVVVVWHTVGSGGDLMQAIEVACDDETEALFAAVMSFWFGSRAMPKMKK